MITTKKPAAKKPAAPKKPRAAKPHAAKPSGKPHAAKPVQKAHVEHAPAHVEKETVAAPAMKAVHGKNFYAVGRRKTAVAQVLMVTGNGTITVNQLPLESYFQTQDLQHIVRQPLVAIGMDKNLNIKGKVHGGGIHSQSEAMRHGIARALLLMDPEARRTVKKLGFLTRDPRVKERKKPGLKRARRAPQFSKR